MLAIEVAPHLHRSWPAIPCLGFANVTGASLSSAPLFDTSRQLESPLQIKRICSGRRFVRLRAAKAIERRRLLHHGYSVPRVLAGRDVAIAVGYPVDDVIVLAELLARAGQDRRLWLR